MESITPSYMDRPGTYRIRVKGRLSQKMADRMWGEIRVTHQMTSSEAETILVGKMGDQAALIGIINALYNMGHAIMAMNPIDEEETEDPEAEDNRSIA